MPIVNLSDQVMMPRIAKIHLGIKVEGQGNRTYPKATEYFVWPQGEENADIREKLIAKFGEKPTSLPIMLPTNDINQFAPQWYRAYSQSWGLVCIGDGETCIRRRMDADTGEIANRNTTNWIWKHDLGCNPQECSIYLKKNCRRVMNLMFFLPDIPGLGVFQIDTSSIYGIKNINSMAKMLQGVVGRCSMISLTLRLGPIEVTPEGTKKKKVYVLHLESDKTIADLVQQAQLPISQVLMLPEPQDDEIPGDLFIDDDNETPPESGEEQSQAPTSGSNPQDETAATGTKKRAPRKKKEDPPQQQEPDLQAPVTSNEEPSVEELIEIPFPAPDPVPVVENIREKSQRLIGLITNPDPDGMGMTNDEGREWLNTIYKVDSLKKMTAAQMDDAISRIQELLKSVNDLAGQEAFDL